MNPTVDPAEEAAERHQAELDDAYQRGYDDGRAEGAAVEAAKVGNALKALDEAVARLQEEQPQWLEALEQNLVALATAIARQVVERELKGSADDITDLVRRGIAEFPLEAAVKVRLNPADLSAISSPLRGDVVESGREVRWVPDPSVAPGGCMVEGPRAVVDGRVEKALDRIYTELVYG
jgi:flagellar assembly protein FliH